MAVPRPTAVPRSRQPGSLARDLPSERFERDERAVLQPLPAGRYTPLVLSPHRLTRPELAAGSARARHPVVEVERRPLAAYAQLAGAEAEA